MANGIIIINYKDDISEADVETLINNFYKENTAIIGGMSYYHTDSKELIESIHAECME